MFHEFEDEELDICVEAIKKEKEEKSIDEIFGSPIYTYTGEQAIEDGELIDVTRNSAVRNNGFKIPVRITKGLHHVLETIPKNNTYESYDGRLFDVMAMTRYAIKCMKDNGSFAVVELLLNSDLVKPIRKEDGINIIRLFAAMDGTNGYPALHIMLPEEY